MVYWYANEIFGSRRIERATYRDIGVRYVAANCHPAHDTICTFRRNNFDAAGQGIRSPEPSERACEGVVDNRRDAANTVAAQTAGAAAQHVPRKSAAQPSCAPSADLSPTGC